MACQDAEPPNASETNETVARSKRAIKLTPKALQNAKINEIMKSRKRLLSVMKLVEELSEDSEIEKEEAEYMRLIAQKELERRTHDAEAERVRQQEIARFESEIANLGADKKC